MESWGYVYFRQMNMDKFLVWNISGFNGFNKQNDVMDFYKDNNVGFYGFVEIKIKNDKQVKILERMF